MNIQGKILVFPNKKYFIIRSPIFISEIIT